MVVFSILGTFIVAKRYYAVKERNKMKIIKASDYEQLSEKAAKITIELVKEKPDAVLGLATGGTPVLTYKLLVDYHRKLHMSFRDVKTINLDEYIGLPEDHPQSYHYFMYNKLFNHIDIRPENIHIPRGNARNLAEECIRYDEILEILHPIDLQLLGIGSNGHIGFNEPGTPFSKKTYITKLSTSTRKANERFFQEEETVPEYAITMGIASILKSKKILLLASGKSKAEAVKQLVLGEMDEQFPASALKQHDNVTILADNQALEELQKVKRI